MDSSKDISGKVRGALDKGNFVIIEREIGAEDGLTLAKNVLTDFDVREATASIKSDNVFSRALPKHSEMLRIRTPPKVMMVYLSDMNGMLLAEAHREESSMDADIFSGMLNAVSNFVKDSIQQWSGEEKEDGGGLDALSYRDENLGNLTIRIRRGEDCVLIVTYKGDISRSIEGDLDKTIRYINENHLTDLKEWSGNTNESFLNNITEELNKTFLGSGRYDGVLDMEDIMENKEEIKTYLSEKVDEISAKGDQLAFLFDDIETIDPLSLDLIKHVVHNTDAVVICQHNTDVLDETEFNEAVGEFIREQEDEGNCTHISIRSDIDIEELVRSKLTDVEPKAMTLLSYAAMIGTFDTDVLKQALKKTDINIGDVMDKLKKAGIIKGNRFANSRLRERALEGIQGKEKKEIELRVAAALIKNNSPQYNIRIAELLLPYASKYDIIRKKAVKYSIKAGDQYLRSFNTDSALKFYNDAIALDSNEERKHQLLEKTLILESLTWI